MCNAYHQILGDLDADLLARVAVHLASTQTFFPAAAEIRRACFHLAEVGLGIPTAQDAWAEVSLMMRKGFWDTKNGWYEVRAPCADDWSHPVVQRAVDAVGGWMALRVSTNTVADRARFLQAYDVYLERQRETERMLPAVRQAVDELSAGTRTPQKRLVAQAVADLADGMRF